ncbi:MAG: 2OG-Fe(II) oxygenase [Acidobacteriaceae bacterium]|nr:2OG-Fe(II) oxygenase [Acidobacteriaceae bacterium]
MAGIFDRLAAVDWPALHSSLWDQGYTLGPAILTPDECAALVNLYSSESAFRSHIIMARYRFGRGDYKYFNYPLPAIVQELREHSYPYLASLANEWNNVLSVSQDFPDKHSSFLSLCKKKGQTRATPLLLHYEAGDFNCLHQDLYGAIAFPLQLTCFLSRPGIDYDGGEFVLVEQQPRAQSKPEVITPAQGQFVVFATRYRPVKSTRGYYRTNLRHGVSRIRRGTRFTLGVIYHDAE